MALLWKGLELLTKVLKTAKSCIWDEERNVSKVLMTKDRQ